MESLNPLEALQEWHNRPEEPTPRQGLPKPCPVDPTNLSGWACSDVVRCPLGGCKDDPPAIVRDHLSEATVALGEVVHACPLGHDARTPCCRRSPSELPMDHRMTTDPDLVTCRPEENPVNLPDAYDEATRPRDPFDLGTPGPTA